MNRGILSSIVITLIGFGLRYLIFRNDLGPSILTLIISLSFAISLGIFLLRGQLRVIGWSLLLGSLLTILFFGTIIYFLATVNYGSLNP